MKDKAMYTKSALRFWGHFFSYESEMFECRQGFVCVDLAIRAHLVRLRTLPICSRRHCFAAVLDKFRTASRDCSASPP